MMFKKFYRNDEALASQPLSVLAAAGITCLILLSVMVSAIPSDVQSSEALAESNDLNDKASSLALGFGDKGLSRDSSGEQIYTSPDKMINYGCKASDEELKTDSDADSELIDSEDITPPVNLPPVADAGGPYSAEVDEVITIDGSGSSDPDGSIVSWEWDLDGDLMFDDASGESIVYSWSSSDLYRVSLKVTDTWGVVDTDSTTVLVSNSGNSPIIHQSLGNMVLDLERNTIIATFVALVEEPDHQETSYDFDWDDGDATEGDLVFQDASNEIPEEPASIDTAEDLQKHQERELIQQIIDPYHGNVDVDLNLPADYGIINEHHTYALDEITDLFRYEIDLIVTDSEGLSDSSQLILENDGENIGFGEDVELILDCIFSAQEGDSNGCGDDFIVGVAEASGDEDLEGKFNPDPY